LKVKSARDAAVHFQKNFTSLGDCIVSYTAQG